MPKDESKKKTKLVYFAETPKEMWRNIDDDAMLNYAFENRDEIMTRAAVGNQQAVSVIRRVARLAQHDEPCDECKHSAAIAAYFYRASILD